MLTEIKRWGNSAAIRLPGKILAQANLDIDSQIRIEVKAGKIVIDAAEKTPRRIKLPFTEAELLKGLDAYGVHADELALPSPAETGV